MGNKDIAEKHFEEINKIFADIVNGTLFGGVQAIKEDELIDLPHKSQYKADDGKLREQERDIVKRWSKENVIFSIIGIENQTKIDKDMVLRVIGYDGASYRSQLTKKGKARRYPVITIVLYYGQEPWNAPISLKERLVIPKELNKYVSDYRINVFDIAHMSTAEINELFNSDYNMFAKQMNGTTDPNEYKREIEFPDQLFKALSATTGDDRFESLVGTYTDGGKDMEKFLDTFMNKVKVEGKAEGKTEANRQAVSNLFKNGASFELVVASIPDLPKDEIQEIFDSIMKDKE